jgi:general nucleoside transport system permease protein
MNHGHRSAASAFFNSLLGPALQSVGVTSGYHLFNAAPYILTLVIMIITCSPKRTLTGAPAELSITR